MSKKETKTVTIRARFTPNEADKIKREISKKRKKLEVEYTDVTGLIRHLIFKWLKGE